MAEADRIIALGECSETQAPHPVNQPTISTWLDAMGYDNERFRDGRGAAVDGAGVDDARARPAARRDDPLHGMMEILTDEGYTAVLGTNCEQTYERYLRVGEQLRVTTALESVAGPKNTAMGRRLLRDLAQPAGTSATRRGGHDAVPGPEVHPEGEGHDRRP